VVDVLVRTTQQDLIPQCAINRCRTIRVEEMRLLRKTENGRDQFPFLDLVP